MASPLEITPQQVKQRLDAGEKLQWIDVREPHEFALAKIEGATLVPMRSVPGELQSLEARADEAPLIVYCHHGVRSAHVAAFLDRAGFGTVYNLAGGIDAWSRDVDPGVPRY